MAPTSTGGCVVCSKPTTTRCGPCLKAGTADMWFCSAEHQKLIWKTHKKVCGDRSNPFAFPLLSKAEAKAVFENWEMSPMTERDGRSWPTVGATLMRDWRKDRKGVEAWIEQLTEGSGRPRFHHIIEQHCLYDVRAYMTLIREAAMRAAPRTLDFFPINNLWEATLGYYPNLNAEVEDDALPPVLDSGLKYRVLIRQTLHEQALNSTPETR